MDCCGRYHQNQDTIAAPDALTLMKSRYSAFVMDELDYLRHTWHPSTRPSDIEPNEPGTRWLGLKIIRHENHAEDRAIVEFVARVRQPNGRALRMHEVSCFVMENGRWYYVDGEFPQV